MAQKKIDENPKITDTVLFELETYDSNSCLFTPYKFDKISIFYVERDFLSTNFGEYEKVNFDSELLADLKTAEAALCADPSDINLFLVQQLTQELEATAQRNTFYYKDAALVYSVGSSTEPAWSSIDVDNAYIDLIEEDSEGNSQEGHFQYLWTPTSKIREGDYFICWTWTPYSSGESLSAHKQFNLFGDPRTVMSIPTHITPEKKYEDILERYLPEMYKMTLTDEDITPDVTDKLNKSVAKGFKYIEDLANQLINLYDGNAVHESLLVYLSNLFNLRLKSADPTLWRRQIKEAIRLFKKKGTEEGLEMAFSQAGMTLNKITRLWQVVSKYTWVESFKVVDSPTFLLSKNIISPIDSDNFGLWVRREDETEYTEYDSTYLEFNSTNCEFGTEITWIGDERSSSPVNLFVGDTIKIMYQHTAIPSGEQSLEDYIRSLSLADQRDETLQLYPFKNWNVKVIEEDDPLFNIVIPVRHPFHEPIVFGKIRTEFPYSENIYNMDEYNGCGVGSTTVITENGLKELKNITDDKFILTEFGFKQFEKLVNQGNRRTLEITTKLGRKITVTSNHQFKILNETGELQWKSANNIIKNDYILGKKCSNLIQKNKGIHKDIWYLAGHVYGDGYQGMKKSINFMISETEPSIKIFIENVFKNHNAKFNIFARSPQKHQKNTSMICNETMYLIRSSKNQMPLLGQILPEYEIKGIWKKHLPPLIWGSGEDQICSFLRGIFDTDGGMQKKSPMLTTKWLTLAREVQNLLLIIGIISSVTKFKVTWKGQKRDYFRVRIIGNESIKLFIDKINFMSNKKKIDLEKIKETTTLSSDRMTIPFGDKIIQNIFPFNKRISKIRSKDRSKEEKRILTLVTRLKQGYQKTIPDNVVSLILEKAITYGNKNQYYEFLLNYVSNNWFFDKVVSVETGPEEDVYDPINVKDTQSYISEGLVSHNSTRDSFDPCFIDKDFVDPCGGSISSKYNLDIAVENLCDERILEIQDIIREYTPFHAVIHSINFQGEINEYVLSPVEEIEFLIRFNINDYVLSGSGNSFFDRVMPDGLSTWQVTRDQLATQATVVSNKTGTGFNTSVGLVTPLIPLDTLGVILDSHILKIFSPSPNSGEYTIKNIIGETAIVVSEVDEPLSESEFTFSLSNIVYETSVAKLYQDNIFKFSDVNIDFSELGVKTLWDIEHTPDYTGDSWQVLISAYSVTPYEVLDIIDGELILYDPDKTLPDTLTTSISYILSNDLDDVKATSNTGRLDVVLRGKLDLNDNNIVNLSDYSKINYLVFYDSVEYKITSLDEDFIYINDYEDGDAVGVNIEIRKRLVEQGSGYFSYKGIQLFTSFDHEAEFEMTNGRNPPTEDPDQIVENNKRIENFLIKISDDYYKIIDIDGQTITLGGLPQDWGLLISGGTLVNYSIHWFEKTEVETQFMVFDQLDRDGKDVVVREIESSISNDLAIVALMMPQGSDISENVHQEEEITFNIIYRNGETTQGVL